MNIGTLLCLNAISITIVACEFAHGYTVYRLGDNITRDAGTNLFIALLVAQVYRLVINIFSEANILVSNFLYLLLWYNIMLGVFNLIGLPLLDGLKILASLLSNKLNYYFYKYEKFLYVLTFIFIIFNGASKVISPAIISMIKGLVVAVFAGGAS